MRSTVICLKHRRRCIQTKERKEWILYLSPENILELCWRTPLILNLQNISLVLITWQKCSKNKHNSGQVAEKAEAHNSAVVWWQCCYLIQICHCCHSKINFQLLTVNLKVTLSIHKYGIERQKKVFTKINGLIVEATWRKYLVMLVRVLASHQCISQTHIPNWPLLIPSYHTIPLLIT